jgi:hypothetical protein
LTQPTAPDPNTVSHEAVANIARRRAGDLYQDVILRDAKIHEQQQHIEHLEGKLRELEQQSTPVTDATTASPRAARPRRNQTEAAEPAPIPG